MTEDELNQYKGFIIFKFGDEAFSCLELARVYFPNCYFDVEFSIGRRGNDCAQWIDILKGVCQEIFIRLYADHTMYVKPRIVQLCAATLEKEFIKMNMIEIIEK